MAGIVGLLVGSFLNVVIYRLPVMMKRDWRAQSLELLAGEDADDYDRTVKMPLRQVADDCDRTVKMPLRQDAGDSDRTVEMPLRQVAGDSERTVEMPTRQDAETFNLVTPRSRCPACNTAIKSYQNVPVISYLLLRGRCAACGTRISARYPAIEALTGILSVLVTMRFGWSIECAGALALTWSLIALSFIDFDEQLLPDSITLPLLWLGLAMNLFAYVPDSPLFVGPENAIAGAIVGYLSLWSVYWGFKLLTGKEGMGYGDFKLLAALGAWMGWKLVLLVIVLSAVVGAIAALGMILFRGHDRQIPIPFGPYIAVAGFVAMLWGPQLVGLYIRVSGLQ